jgi:very-short-patch-repair endonuclease
VDAHLARIAAAQGGVFSRRQALAAGYTNDRIVHQVRRGAWQRVARAVYRVNGAPTSWQASAWVAILTVGPPAVLSYRATGYLHGFDGLPAPGRFDVSVPENRRPRTLPIGSLHRVELPRCDIATRNGLPVTSPARTLVDLAFILRGDLAARVMADALRRRLATVESVGEQIDAAGGRHGIQSARDALRTADPRLECTLEHELLQLVRRAGLDPTPQFEVFAGGLFVARVDLGVPELKLAIEADGYATHALRPGFERDRERAALLQLAGWTTLAFTATHIRRRPDWLIDVVQRRARQLGAVIL